MMINNSIYPEQNLPEKDYAESNPSLSLSLSAPEKARYFEAVRTYLESRQQKLKVVKTTTTRKGQVLDWIPIESQTSDHQIASPPPTESTDFLYSQDVSQPTQLVTFELEQQQESRGPAGTIPILRRDVQQLRPVSSQQDFLSKHGGPTYLLRINDNDEIAIAATASKHWYAYSAQYETCYGGEGHINAWSPYVQWSNEFSLGQIALARGSGNGKQTIEAGWQTYKQLYGDWEPHLFIFYTTNGYSQSGDNLGGYNQDVDGWVQYSNTLYPGALSSPVSTLGGTQYDMFVKFQLYQGNWWLKINNIWMGYYPASLFNAAGLQSQASKIAWYGEVVDAASDPDMTRTDMGSGHWPYEGWQSCAYMRNLRYQSSTSGTMNRYAPGTVKPIDNRECYDIEGHFDNTGSWQSYFWWGGSGRNAKCK